MSHIKEKNTAHCNNVNIYIYFKKQALKYCYNIQLHQKKAEKSKRSNTKKIYMHDCIIDEHVKLWIFLAIKCFFWQFLQYKKEATLQKKYLNIYIGLPVMYFFCNDYYLHNLNE